MESKNSSEAGSVVRLMTTAEAAELLRVSKAFLERDRCAKIPLVPYVKFTRSVRYRREDLLTFLSAHLVAPKAGA